MPDSVNGVDQIRTPDGLAAVAAKAARARQAAPALATGSLAGRPRAEPIRSPMR